MHKLRQYLVLASVLLLLSSSDLSKFCNHQIKGLKFSASRLEASTPTPVSELADYAPSGHSGYSSMVSEEDASLLQEEEISPADIDTQIMEATIVWVDSVDQPITLTWDQLEAVEYKKKYNKEYDQYFAFPVFGAKLKALDGRQVSIRGYIIPLDVGVYALSKYPYASCFFCGGAGPETISGITFAKPGKRYKTDEVLTLRGVFKLNSTDVDKFMYQLYEVEVVK